MGISSQLDDIANFCVDIREVLGTADMSTELGISNMLRDTRTLLENIEGRVKQIQEAWDDAT